MFSLLSRLPDRLSWGWLHKLPIKRMAAVNDENAYCASALLERTEQRMQKRRRFKQTKSLEVRLAEEAVRLREQAQLLPRGRLRDEVEKKAIQIEAACEVTELLRSPG
jgi:hypothetical protein